jgi:hypothetical protein
MHLIKQWGDIDMKNMMLGEKPAIFCYLPENMIMDMIEVQTAMLKTNQKGIKIFTPDYVITLMEFMTVIVRSG